MAGANRFTCSVPGLTYQVFDGLTETPQKATNGPKPTLDKLSERRSRSLHSRHSLRSRDPKLAECSRCGQNGLSNNLCYAGRKSAFAAYGMGEDNEGGYLSGRVEYRIENNFKFPLFCHCEQCRRISGSPAKDTTARMAQVLSELQRLRPWVVAER